MVAHPHSLILSSQATPRWATWSAAPWRRPANRLAPSSSPLPWQSFENHACVQVRFPDIWDVNMRWWLRGHRISSYKTCCETPVGVFFPYLHLHYHTCSINKERDTSSDFLHSSSNIRKNTFPNRFYHAFRLPARSHRRRDLRSLSRWSLVPCRWSWRVKLYCCSMPDRVLCVWLSTKSRWLRHSYCSIRSMHDCSDCAWVSVQDMGLHDRHVVRLY